MKKPALVNIAHLFMLIGGMPTVLATCSDTQPLTPFTAAWTGNTVWLREWLEGGGSPNATDENGDSLLYLSTGPKGSLEVTRLLLQRGADPNLCKEGGYSPLMNAASWSSIKAVELLLAYGADVCYRSANGKNAYDVAMTTKPRNAGLIRLLAERVNDDCGSDTKKEVDTTQSGQADQAD